MTTSHLTTTNIGKEELKHLRKQSIQHGLKQVEFVNAAINYFRKTGINPAEEIFSPREEIAKLTKRVDEVIRFLQVHEKQKLSPLMERLIILEKRLADSTSSQITSSDLHEITALLNHVKTTIGDMVSRGMYTLNSKSESTLDKVNGLVRNQSHIVTLLSLLFEGLKNRNIAGGLKEVDIQNFQNALSQIR